MPFGRIQTYVVAAFLFFCSGALGLGYEFIWIRSAASVVGASQIALGTVLTAFFFGLASGSYVTGRFLRTDRVSPLLVYGLYEAAIGIFALAFPGLFSALRVAYDAAYPWCGQSEIALFGLRFALLFVLFVGPTFLMGGTLPLLLDGLVSRDRNVGAATGALYGINILGAVAGVLLTGYVLLPKLGVAGTSRIGGAANLAVALAALTFLGRGGKPTHETERAAIDMFFRVAAFASGSLALAYQICWARYFSLTHFSSIHLTAILLAVYLFALSAGSLLLVPAFRRSWHPLRVFALVQVFVPIATLLCLEAWRLADYRMVVERLPSGRGPAQFVPTLELAQDAPKFWHLFSETADAIFFAPLFQVTLSIAVPVLCIGTGLPALITAATPHASSVKSVSGSLVCWNTLGAAAGSFLSSYLLLPVFGLHRTLLALGIGTLSLSAITILRLGRRDRAALAVPGAGFLLLTSLAVWKEDVVRATIRQQQFGRGSSSARLTGLSEGPLTTAFVFEDDTTIRIASGAVQMGSIDKRGVNPQVIEGHLPVLFYPGAAWPRNCLGICLGTGQSFGALLRYPVAQLDVVEISGEIAELSRRLLGPYNRHLADDPRVRLVLDDGRHFVERAPPESYDLVSMESPPPIADGVHRLYSLEFYREVRRVLRPGGVFMQFMPLYYLSPLDAKSVVKTLAQVFPHTFIVKVSAGDFMLLAYPRRPTFPVAALSERARVLAEEWSSRDLAQGYWSKGSARPIASFEGVTAMLLMGPEDVAALDAPVLLRDDDLALSYGTGDRWLTRRYMGPLLTSVSFPAFHPTAFSSLRSYFEPALSDPVVDALTNERVAALQPFHVPSPREVQRGREAIAQATDPVARASAAFALAEVFDAAHQKEEALRLVAVALAALEARPDLTRSEHVAAARQIVRGQLVVYRELTAGWLASLRGRYAESPIYQGMSAEFASYESRRRQTAARYLAPGVF